MFAGAAIGASHLVQSTRAGALFGYGLILFVILSNFFKYPFFQYGQRYTAVTGESIIDGYAHLGKWAVLLFYVINHFTATISTAGVTFVTAALSSFFVELLFGYSIDLTLMSAIILVSILGILFIGKYSLLDKLVKIFIVMLSITTVFAYFYADGVDLFSSMNIPTDLFDISSPTFFFLVALMGWMPAPIEASTWASVWMLARQKETGYKPELKTTLMDFNVGYIGTSVLALFFLGLGAKIMYNSGQEFSTSAIGFVKQLISLYTDTFGEWSLVLIIMITLATMASTTLTVVDAYPRTLENALGNLMPKLKDKSEKVYWFYLFFMSSVALIIIHLFRTDFKSMIDFATTIAFLGGPIFAILNYLLVKSKRMPKETRPSGFLNYLSIGGIIFLSGFALLFIIAKAIN